MPKELSTGLVIAGAYADKLRRTLFAQLRDHVKQNKDFAKEVARASAEVNSLIYIVLVEKLKADKGDVVRIRIQYDVEDGRIKWYYDTLRIEYFKRVPDEQVTKIVEETIREKAEEIRRQYAEAPIREEVEEKEVAVEEKPAPPKEVEEARVEEKPPAEIKEVPPPEVKLNEIVTEAAPIGETMEGGVVFEIKNKSGENVGIASVEPRGETFVAEAVVLPKPGEAYKIYVKLSETIETYKDDPSKLVNELVKGRPVKISAEEAKDILRAKMEALI